MPRVGKLLCSRVFFRTRLDSLLTHSTVVRLAFVFSRLDPCRQNEFVGWLAWEHRLQATECQISRRLSGQTNCQQTDKSQDRTCDQLAAAQPRDPPRSPTSLAPIRALVLGAGSPPQFTPHFNILLSSFHLDTHSYATQSGMSSALCDFVMFRKLMVELLCVVELSHIDRTTPMKLTSTTSVSSWDLSYLL